MDCSRCRVLACVSCASDRCNAIDTLYRNRGHIKLMESLHILLRKSRTLPKNDPTYQTMRCTSQEQSSSQLRDAWTIRSSYLCVYCKVMSIDIEFINYTRMHMEFTETKLLAEPTI